MIYLLEKNERKQLIKYAVIFVINNNNQTNKNKQENFKF